jgi:hypothetical protein
MLFDPKWEVKADPFSLLDFISWLETKSPGARYDFDNCQGECLMGQYMAARGRDWVYGPIDCKTPYWQSCLEVFDGDVSDGAHVLAGYPRTFGGALERARSVQR